MLRITMYVHLNYPITSYLTLKSSLPVVWRLTLVNSSNGLCLPDVVNKIGFGLVAVPMDTCVQDGIMPNRDFRNRVSSVYYRVCTYMYQIHA